MVQVILAYLLIFTIIFLSSVSITFTVLKSQIQSPSTSKFSILKQKREINGILRHFNVVSSSHKLIQQNLELIKTELDYKILFTDSLLSEMRLIQNRLNNYEKTLKSNDKKLDDMLK